MSKYIELTIENFQEVTSKGVSLVDFWAPWCGPCRMIGPIIEELAEDFEGKANICKINTDEQQDFVFKFNIKSIPTIIFLKDGQVVDSFSGIKTKKEITDLINSLI